MKSEILDRRERVFRPAWLICIVFIFFAACSKQPSYPVPPQRGSEIVLDVRFLQPETPVFFTYRYHGKRISFFVVRTGNRVNSFLDACASCYPHKRGYKYENGMLVCRFCNVEYSMAKIEGGIGGCYPIRITGSVRGAEYHIPVSALESMADKF